MTPDLPESVVRAVVVPAPPEVVWRFLSTDEGWAEWWGAGSTVQAAVGGAMAIVYPNDQTAVGTVTAVEPLETISFTWGYPRDDSPVPVDGSTVTITLTAAGGATTVRVEHRLADEAVARQHAPGWRFQLGLFRALVARHAFADGLAALIDGWHAAWSVSPDGTDAVEPAPALATVVTDDVAVDEPMAELRGLADVASWVAQVRQILPATVRRTGDPALCHDLVLWDWEIVSGGAVVATGRSAGRLTPAGRFREITAVWLTAPPGFAVSTVQETGS